MQNETNNITLTLSFVERDCLQNQLNIRLAQLKEVCWQAEELELHAIKERFEKQRKTILDILAKL